MKKIIYGLLITSISAFVMSCSNGDYQADPDSPANEAVNPITPLGDDEFTWGGEKPMSYKVNGNFHKADYAGFALDTSGTNVIIGVMDNAPARMQFYLRDVWKGNLYSMEWQNYTRMATYTDSLYGKYLQFSSDRSNSGGIKILRNDTAVIEAKFYFKGVTANGEVVNISDGYFYIEKY